MTENDYTQRTSNPEQSSAGSQDLRARAEDAVDAAKDRVEETFEEAEECVRYNPLLAVLAALLGGFIIALVAIPRKKSWRERHIDEPLDRSQTAIVAAALASGALLKELLNSASTTKRQAAKGARGYSKTAKKAVKRAARKINF
jgi:hypothetical protein